MSSGVAQHLGAETLSAYLDEELAIEENDTARDHLSSCLHCRQRLEGLRRVAAGLRGLERVSTPVVLEQAIQRRIALEGSRRSLIDRLEERRQGRRRLWPHVVVGFSLVVALAAILYLFAQALERQAQAPVLVIPGASSAAVTAERTIDGEPFVYEREQNRWRQVVATAAPARRLALGSEAASSLLTAMPELREVLGGAESPAAIVVVDGETVELVPAP